MHANAADPVARIVVFRHSTPYGRDAVTDQPETTFKHSYFYIKHVRGDVGGVTAGLTSERPGRGSRTRDSRPYSGLHLFFFKLELVTISEALDGYFSEYYEDQGSPTHPDVRFWLPESRK